MVDKNDLALARANADFATANENSRASAQAAILISGGAATAILAYLAKEAASPPTLLALAPIALLIYAAGVSLAALGLRFTSSSIAQWGYYWQEMIGKDGAEAAGDAERRVLATHANTVANRCVYSSFACFAIASVLLAAGFLIAFART
jgi:hypothetical protein